jgi:hypothetical protein
LAAPDGGGGYDAGARLGAKTDTPGIVQDERGTLAHGGYGAQQSATMVMIVFIGPSRGSSCCLSFSGRSLIMASRRASSERKQDSGFRRKDFVISDVSVPGGVGM